MFRSLRGWCLKSTGRATCWFELSCSLLVTCPHLPIYFSSVFFFFFGFFLCGCWCVGCSGSCSSCLASPARSVLPSAHLCPPWPSPPHEMEGRPPTISPTHTVDHDRYPRAPDARLSPPFFLTSKCSGGSFLRNAAVRSQRPVSF